MQLAEDLGDHSIMHLESAASEDHLLAKVESGPAGEGDKVTFELPPDECHVFDAGERALPRLDRSA